MIISIHICLNVISKISALSQINFDPMPVTQFLWKSLLRLKSSVFPHTQRRWEMKNWEGLDKGLKISISYIGKNKAKFWKKKTRENRFTRSESNNYQYSWLSKKNFIFFHLSVHLFPVRLSLFDLLVLRVYRLYRKHSFGCKEPSAVRNQKPTQKESFWG